MTNQYKSPSERNTSIENIEMAQAIGGVVVPDGVDLEVLGLSPDEQRATIDNRHKLGERRPRESGDLTAEQKSEAYFNAHQIGGISSGVGSSHESVTGILNSDGVADIAKEVVSLVGEKTPASVAASAQRRHPEVTSKPEPPFDEMWIDGIMKRVPRN